MIQVKKIVPETIEVFDPQGNSLDFINEYEFLDLRVQCKEQKVRGYYCYYNEEKITIDTDGRLEGNVHKDFFDLHLSLLCKLF